MEATNKSHRCSGMGSLDYKMKKTILLALFATALFATPDWYGKLTPTVQAELIGYGEGSTLEEAKATAKSDIAHSIYSHVSSSVGSSTQVSGKDIKSSAFQSVEDRSDVVLSDAKVLQSEQEKSSSRWFVAMSYDNRPFEEKLFSTLGSRVCSNTPHPYLSNTLLLQKIAKRAGCTKWADVQITHDNGIWYVGKNDIRLPFGSKIPEETMQKLSSAGTAKLTK